MKLFRWFLLRKARPSELRVLTLHALLPAVVCGVICSVVLRHVLKIPLFAGLIPELSSLGAVALTLALIGHWSLAFASVKGRPRQLADSLLLFLVTACGGAALFIADGNWQLAAVLALTVPAVDRMAWETLHTVPEGKKCLETLAALRADTPA
jgi:hypothetical protein